MRDANFASESSRGRDLSFWGTYTGLYATHKFMPDIGPNWHPYAENPCEDTLADRIDRYSEGLRNTFFINFVYGIIARGALPEGTSVLNAKVIYTP